jgi:hypothetical protein
MSLLKYFNKVVTPSTPTKRKADELSSVTKKLKLNSLETVSEKNRKYDSQKRERKFQQHWQDTYTWLLYNKEENTMSCNVCKEYPKLASTIPGQTPVFVTGTDNFRIEPIRCHELSAPHKSCLSQLEKEHLLFTSNCSLSYNVFKYH